MRAREVRALARESLQNKWGTAALLTLVYTLITIVISFISGVIPLVGSIASIVISPVLTFGFLVSIIKLARNENPSYIEFFDNGFSLFGKVWGVTLHTALRLLLPILVIIVGIVVLALGIAYLSIEPDSLGLLVVGSLIYVVGIVWTIVKTYAYVLTSYILNDEPTLKSVEIVRKSAQLMKGNKWRFFCLNFSFIGWSILAGFTLGIGLLWLNPYMQISALKFYEELVSTNYSGSTDTDI